MKISAVLVRIEMLCFCAPEWVRLPHVPHGTYVVTISCGLFIFPFSRHQWFVKIVGGKLGR